MTEPPQQAKKPLKTYPALGIVAVLLGASLATFLGRLISVGSGDLRGALHYDLDGASWLSTSYNMGLMFIGPFSVYLAGLLGVRRVLLACAAIFAVVCFAMPFNGELNVFLALLAVAGLAAGTFYPLTLSFLLRSFPQKYMVFGIGAYATDIVVTTHVAHSYEAWLMRVLSWRWMFWTEALLSVVMVATVYFGMPRQPLPSLDPAKPKPSWRGFLYASAGFALLYGAMDQGTRLDWWRSNLFVAMCVTGLFLVGAAAVRHFVEPNPMINFRFLAQRNTFVLAATVVAFRFVLLAAVVLVPSFLTSAQGYTAEQIGPVLLWIAVPQLLTSALAVLLLARLDSRILLASGFAIVAIGCLCNAHVTSVWSGTTFDSAQLILAMGESFAFTGLVGTIVLEVINSGALSRPIDVLTFAGTFQAIRLLGGEAGASFIQFSLQNRERFHSNLAGLHVQSGGYETAQRLSPLTAGLFPASGAPEIAGARASALIGLTVRNQAFTLAVADNFLLLAYAAVACMVLIAFLGTVKLQFKQVASLSLSPTK